MATLHLMIGLPCSGKTTYARTLAEKENALLLTPDVWQIKLFGSDMIQENHDVYHDRIEKIMWDVAERALTLGCSVILDFGCWARVERDDFRSRAKRIGAGFKLHYMEISNEELFRRLEERNRNLTGDVFMIPREEMEKYIGLFQPPEAEELL